MGPRPGEGCSVNLSVVGGSRRIEITSGPDAPTASSIGGTTAGGSTATPTRAGLDRVSIRSTARAVHVHGSSQVCAASGVHLRTCPEVDAATGTVPVFIGLLFDQRGTSPEVSRHFREVRAHLNPRAGGHGLRYFHRRPPDGRLGRERSAGPRKSSVRAAIERCHRLATRHRAHRSWSVRGRVRSTRCATRRCWRRAHVDDTRATRRQRCKVIWCGTCTSGDSHEPRHRHLFTRPRRRTPPTGRAPTGISPRSTPHRVCVPRVSERWSSVVAARPATPG